MNVPQTHAAAGDAAAGLAPSSHSASGGLQARGGSPRYCPTELLASFALLMAGHGRCVITNMMLGDREYAMWQLAWARATDDEELVAVASRLLSYFDDPHHTGMAVTGTA